MPRRLVFALLACSCTPHPAAPVSAPSTAAPVGAPAAPSFAAQPGDIAITDVTVVPMSTDGELAHRTVVIRGDRIAAIAPAASLHLPSGTTIIDGSGQWLMPGLADMHVHVWGEDQLALFVAAGVTTVRNMFGNPHHLEWRKQLARGALFGPTLVTAGPIIDGDPPVWPGSTVLSDPADADRIVSEQKAAAYDS
jgi:hypothetical protein